MSERREIIERREGYYWSVRMGFTKYKKGEGKYDDKAEIEMALSGNEPSLAQAKHQLETSARDILHELRTRLAMLIEQG